MRGDGYYFSSLRHSTDYGADGLQKLPAELGSVFHCLLLFTRIERKADKKRKLDHKKEKEWTDRSGCRTSIGEQRMQVDGFTAGVSLTERISGGFNIKTEGATKPKTLGGHRRRHRRFGRLPRRQRRLVLNNKRSGSANNPTNNVDLFHRQRLPRLPSYILLHSLQTRRVRMGCAKSTRLVQLI